MKIKLILLFACITLVGTFASVQGGDPQRIGVLPINRTEQKLYIALVKIHKGVITDKPYSITLDPSSDWPDYIWVATQKASQVIAFMVSSSPALTQSLKAGKRLAALNMPHSYVVIPQDCARKLDVEVTGKEPFNIAIPACASVTRTIHVGVQKETPTVSEAESLEVYLNNTTNQNIYGALITLEGNVIREIIHRFTLDPVADLPFPISLDKKALSQVNRTFKLLVSTSKDFNTKFSLNDNISGLSGRYSTHSLPQNCTGDITLTITGKDKLSIKQTKGANVTCSSWFKKKK